MTRIPYRTYIRCFVDTLAFETPLIKQGDSPLRAESIIAYYNGQGFINVRHETCVNARRFIGFYNGKTPVLNDTTTGAIATILHETLHRQGIHNERLAECYANAAVKEGGQLARYNSLPTQDEASWEVSEKYGSRAQALAFIHSARYIASSYQMNKAACLGIVEDTSWADFVRTGSFRVTHDSFVRQVVRDSLNSIAAKLKAAAACRWCPEATGAIQGIARATRDALTKLDPSDLSKSVARGRTAAIGAFDSYDTLADSAFHIRVALNATSAREYTASYKDAVKDTLTYTRRTLAALKITIQRP